MIKWSNKLLLPLSVENKVCPAVLQSNLFKQGNETSIHRSHYYQLQGLTFTIQLDI